MDFSCQMAFSSENSDWEIFFLVGRAWEGESVTDRVCLEMNRQGPGWQGERCSDARKRSVALEAFACSSLISLGKICPVFQPEANPGSLPCAWDYRTRMVAPTIQVFYVQIFNLPLFTLILNSVYSIGNTSSGTSRQTGVQALVTDSGLWLSLVILSSNLILTAPPFLQKNGKPLIRWWPPLFFVLLGDFSRLCFFQWGLRRGRW